MQGGGLDPLMYITATIPLHRAIMQQGKGVPIMGDTDRLGPVGTVGLVDDTAVMGTGVEELQETLNEVRTVLGVLQQRTNESKFKGIMPKIEDGKVRAFQPKLNWRADHHGPKWTVCQASGGWCQCRGSGGFCRG